jgi:hypothetical protein
MKFVKQSPWNAVDRTTLMSFLVSDTGVKLLELIQMDSPLPRSMNGASIESFALQSARHAGWGDVIDYIEALTMAKPDTVGGINWHHEEEEDPRKLRPNPL